jgi:hypothetical protein
MIKEKIVGYEKPEMSVQVTVTKEGNYKVTVIGETSYSFTCATLDDAMQTFHDIVDVMKEEGV